MLLWKWHMRILFYWYHRRFFPILRFLLYRKARERNHQNSLSCLQQDRLFLAFAYVIPGLVERLAAFLDPEKSEDTFFWTIKEQKDPLTLHFSSFSRSWKIPLYSSCLSWRCRLQSGPSTSRMFCRYFINTSWMYASIRSTHHPQIYKRWLEFCSNESISRIIFLCGMWLDILAYYASRLQ